ERRDESLRGSLRLREITQVRELMAARLQTETIHDRPDVFGRHGPALMALGEVVQGVLANVGVLVDQEGIDLLGAQHLTRQYASPGRSQAPRRAAPQLSDSIRSIGTLARSRSSADISILGCRSRSARYTFSNVFSFMNGHSLQAQLPSGGPSMNSLSGDAFRIWWI